MNSRILLTGLVVWLISCESTETDIAEYTTTPLTEHEVLVDYESQKLLQPGQLVVSEDPHRIIVADNGDYSLKVFNPEGELLDQLGAGGPGPGEFLVINSLHLSGGSLYTFDQGLSRFSKFNFEDGFADSYPIDTGELPFTYQTVFEDMLVSSTAGSGETLIATFDKDGTPADSLGSTHSPVSEMGPIMQEIPQQAENRQVPDYFTNIANVISNDDYLWVAMTAYPKLYLIDRNWEMKAFSFEVERKELVENYYFDQQSGISPVLNMQYISDLAVTGQYLYVLNIVNFTEDYAPVVYQVDHNGRIKNRYKLQEHTGGAFQIAVSQDDQFVYVISQDAASLIRYEL